MDWTSGLSLLSRGKVLVAAASQVPSAIRRAACSAARAAGGMSSGIATQGCRRVIQRFRRAGRGEVTAESALADGALVATGSVLMFVPGLVTGVLGLLLLLPPTRAVARPVLEKLSNRRFGPLPTFAPAP